MQRKFLLNLLLALFLNVLVKPFYILGIDAEVLNRVEKYYPGSYGAYFSLLGLSFIFNIFLDIGITNYNTRNVAQHSHMLPKYFSKFIGVRFLLAIVYIALLFVAGLMFNYDNHHFFILMLLGVNQILVAFILFVRSNLSGLMLFAKDSILSVLDRMLLILIGSVFLWGGVYQKPIKIEWFVFAQTFAYAITLLVGLLFMRRNVKVLKIDFNRKMSIAILKQSYPYALLVLLMMIYYRVDSVMLERMLDDGGVEAATYAKGFRFFEAYNMVAYLFAGLLLPMFASMLKNKKVNEVTDLIYLSFKTLLTISIILGVSSFMMSEEIMQWRFHDSGSELISSSFSFSILMGCFVSVTITYIFGTLLTANGSLKTLNYIAGIGVVINVFLNYLLIPKNGAVGAATASFVTQALTAVVQLIVAFSLIRLKFEIKQFLTVFLFVSVFVGSLYFIDNYLQLFWVYKFLVFIISGGVIAFVTRMINLKEVVKIVASKQ